MHNNHNLLRLFGFLALCWLCQDGLLAQGVPLPKVSIGFDNSQNPTDLVQALKIVLILTVLTLTPSILMSMTSFTRLLIVFSFLRQAMGVQQTPPNQVIVGLSLFLTFFVMYPTFEKINETALKPYMDQKMNYEQAFELGIEPLRDFMLLQTRKTDLALFLKLSKGEKPKNKAEISILTLIPAFIISELKTAFQIGFMIYIPFLVIDMAVATTLMAMGMMVLPPIVISLPFKLMLFVLVDGWNLTVESLIRSFS